MLAALPFAGAAALAVGVALTGPDISPSHAYRAEASANQIAARNGARASITECHESAVTSASAPQESDLIMFMGYSKNGVGETFAKLYDELSQTVFVLDRKSVDERVKNLRGQGLSAEETERVVRDWPARRNVEF